MSTVSLEHTRVPEAHSGQAVFDVARAAGLRPRLLAPPTPPKEALADPAMLDRWFEAAGEYYGIEVEPVETKFSELEAMVARCAPCIIRITDADGSTSLLPVLESSRKHLVALLPGQLRRRVATATVVNALRAPTERKFSPALTRWTSPLPLNEKAKRKAYDALLSEIAEGHAISGVFLLRPRPGASFSNQLRHSGDLSRVFAFAVLTILQVGLGVLGWSSLFDAALSGRLENSPLLRWVLLSASIALVEIIRTFVVGRLNVSVAALLKRRLLAGTLHLDPNDIRVRGSGGLLAMISEAEVLENSGLTSVVSVLSAGVSIACAAIVLSRGVGGMLHVLLLFAWCGVVGTAMFVLNRRTRSWVDFRLAMTNRLVERMVGHRTRLTQQRPSERHKDEDAELELYLAESGQLDRVVRLVQSLPSRGWLLIGFLSLLPALWSGDVDVRLLLMTIAGLFLGQSAFSDVAASVTGVLNLSVAWSRVGDLFRAAAHEEPHGLPAAAVQEIGTVTATGADETLIDAEVNDMLGGDGAVLEARRVTFRYGSGGEPVLRGVELRVKHGERLLIEGKSGGGKSTLAGILAGLRDPDSGLVLHHGLDRATLGTSTWRRRVASVPQFHENHVLSGSLLFNLLLGRRWPPGPGDRALAEEICRSLGLGPMLDRMPSELEQIVGETGWQLSHGERSRVYLARALLQDAAVVLVDESFGALDPHTLRVALDATWARAPTLVVIAHP